LKLFLNIVLTRLFTTLASLLMLVVVVLEVVGGLVFIIFYLITGIQGPMFAIANLVGEKLSSFKYVEDQ